MRVLLDAARMAASGVDPAALIFAFEMQNAASPAGAFEETNREVLVETGAFLRDVDEIASLVVAVHQGRPVYLRDVAEVTDGAEEPSSYVFHRAGAATSAEAEATEELLPAVTLSVAKRRGSDAHQQSGSRLPAEGPRSSSSR